MEKQRYYYTGPVYVNDCLASPYWSSATWASSPQKAIANLKFRYKTQNYYKPHENIVLPGKLKIA